MLRTSVTGAMTAIAILMSPILAHAQSAGGAASGPSAGTGSAVGSPNAGSAGAVTAGVSGVPPGPASAGGLNNSGNDPSGIGNSSKLASPTSPGTNSAGTANSTGSGVNPGSGVTTGTARFAPGGTAAAGHRTRENTTIDAEDKVLDRKIKSICRGC